MALSAYAARIRSCPGWGSTGALPPPLWSPRGLTRVADGAGVPARALQAVFYALIALSVVGNLLVPLLVRR